MNPTHRIDRKGLTVERIGATIQILIFIVIYGIGQIIYLFFFDDFPYWILLIPLFIALLIGVYGLILRPYYMYKNFRYEILAKEINIKSGIFIVQEISLPLGRIQNVDLYEGFIMRKFALANISLSTAGGNHKIIYIKVDTANEIKNTIQNKLENKTTNEADYKLINEKDDVE